MEKKKTDKIQDQEKELLQCLEEAKSSNDFIRFDKALVKLHKIRTAQNRPKPEKAK
jgi:hypothetical protein